MGFSKLRKELKVFDKDKLISLIGNLYNKHRVVKNYLGYYLNPQEEALLKKYKGKVFDSSYTKNGIYSLKDARKAINDFKKHSPSKDSLADFSCVLWKLV